MVWLASHADVLRASSRAPPPRVTSLVGSGGRDEKVGGTFVNLPAAVFSVSFRPSEARTKPGRLARQNRAKTYEGNERKRLPLRQVLCLGKGKQIEREGKGALPLPFTPEILTYFFAAGGGGLYGIIKFRIIFNSNSMPLGLHKGSYAVNNAPVHSHIFSIAALRCKKNVSSHRYYTINANSRHRPFLLSSSILKQKI